MVAGFAQHLDAGSHVIALSHTQIVKSNLSITETFGFIRMKAYSTEDQPFTAVAIRFGVRDTDQRFCRGLHDEYIWFHIFPRHQHGVRWVYRHAVSLLP